MKFEYIVLIVLVVILAAHIFLNKNVNFKGGLVKLSQELGKFPRPQISRGYKQLSKQNVKDPLYSQPEGKIDESKVNIIRSSNLQNDKNPIYYNPSAYKKDFMSPNPLGSTEYNFAEFNDEKTSYAWTDNNVSQHPAFYRSEFSDEKTNVGKFFDKTNQFHDKTSSYSTNNLPDRCFLDKEDNIVCNFNDRLQNIPPSLINEKNNKILDYIGILGEKNSLYKDIDSQSIQNVGGNDHIMYKYNEEKEMNGSEVIKGVHGSNTTNEHYLDLNSLDYKNKFSI
jgi:hypothetical protein